MNSSTRRETRHAPPVATEPEFDATQFRRALATFFECTPYAMYDGGDHAIFVGRVIGLSSRPDGQALVFFRSRYASLDDESGREADAVLTREWPLPIHY